MNSTSETPLLNGMNNVPISSNNINLSNGRPLLANTADPVQPRYKRSGIFGPVLNMVKPLSHEERRYEKLRDAIVHHNIDEIKRLIKAGVDVNKYSDGQTPLTYTAAASEYRIHGFDSAAEIAQILIAAGANVDAVDIEGQTSLHHAVFDKNIDLVRVLLAAGANINAPGHYGNTPLQDATEFHHLNIMELLIKSGANTEATYGNTPLLTAIVYGNIDSVRLLLDQGVNVNKMTPRNKTDIFFVHGVSSEMARAIVRLLREAGLEKKFKFYKDLNIPLKENPSGGSRKTKKRNKKTRRS